MKRWDEEWYLYHSAKNEPPLLWLIPLSLFVFICKDGIIIDIMLWIGYWLYCKYNNYQLSQDPYIIKRRMEFIQWEKWLSENKESWEASVKAGEDQIGRRPL